MNIVSAFITLSMIWCVDFFVMLPIGVMVEKKHEPGHASSAPAQFNLKEKIKRTTWISFFLFLIAYVLISKGLLSSFIT